MNESAEYIVNFSSITQSKCEDKSTNSGDISSDMSRVILAASLSSVSQSEDGDANSVVGFSKDNPMRCSQPCNSTKFSDNSLRSCVTGIHGINYKQNNSPIPTRPTRRFDSRPKIRYVKSNWKIASDNCWTRNSISSSPFDRTSKRASNVYVTNSNGNSAKRYKEADFRTHCRWKD